MSNDSTETRHKINKRGQEIAKKLGSGLLYNGAHYDNGAFYGWWFTLSLGDGLGTSFLCRDLADCAAKLERAKELRLKDAPRAKKPTSLDELVARRVLRGD
jgi:hypothetical protein